MALGKVDQRPVRQAGHQAGLVEQRLRLATRLGRAIRQRNDAQPGHIGRRQPARQRVAVLPGLHPGHQAPTGVAHVLGRLGVWQRQVDH